VNAWLAWDANVRVAATALVGLLLGAVVNWAVSSLAYEPRGFSPWSRKHPHDGRSRGLDRLPIVGWLRLRRKAATLGRGYWIRPLVVEVGFAALCAALYWWEVLQTGLLRVPLPPAAAADPMFALPLHFAYCAHVVLAAFMLAASLIDADERTIPDAVTVPGTLVGLAFITALPWALLPMEMSPPDQLDVLTASFGLGDAVVEANRPHTASLVVGLACFWLWCGGLLYRPWRTSRGYGTALRLLARGVRRDRATPLIGILAAVGTVVIAAIWYYEQIRWIGLITSLVGLAAAGLIVWVTRIVGGWALQQQAMGFGDVTLMAMIGAFTGWQAAVLIFFLAPIAALLVHGLMWLFTRDNALPYGPYLCLSTAVVVGGWRWIWPPAELRFAVSWLIPIVLVVGFILLGVILALLRAVRFRS